MSSQGRIWLLAAVVAAAAAVLGATNGDAVFAIAFGLAAVAFVVAGVRSPQART